MTLEPDSTRRYSALTRRQLIGGVVVTWASVSWWTNVASAKPADVTPTDPYERYVQNSEDFKSVKKIGFSKISNFPKWLYMPWTFQWNIGYTDSSGKWSVNNGYNGAFLDGNGGQPDSPPGKLDWVDKYQLPFYVDHCAGKGSLHLWDGGKQKPYQAELNGRGVRTVPLGAPLAIKLDGLIKNNLSQVVRSPFRAAYALDDETSWGYFVHPTMWQIVDDPNLYRRWLTEIYGAEDAPLREKWFTYDDIRLNLPTWTVADFDASSVLDQWTFNDSTWCNFLGDRVEYANSVDPQTRCGIVGAQNPSAFGGYDYAKLMRKIQYIEAYNIGSSQAIIRSFGSVGPIPAVTTHFHQSVEDDIWQIWYYLAHGNRGFIGWVENWFDGTVPKPWLAAIAPQLLEIENEISPLLSTAKWHHDGVALYYSQASLQLGWILDAQPHGSTWVNRDSDHRLGAAHLVRHAWENMLRDSGIQYNHIEYVDVIQNGIDPAYKVLVLPACLSLSDAEARAIMSFCSRGGTVIADYLPGVWDQHGRGRKTGGALDALFGVHHDPAMTSADVFGGKIWAEVDQDLNFSWTSYTEFMTNGSTCIKDETGFNKAVRKMPTQTVLKYGHGTAVLMNLSPQWYNAYRSQGQTAAHLRTAFIKHISASGVSRWVDIENPTDEDFGYEISYFKRPDGRVVLFLCFNPEVEGSEVGGGNAVGLKSGETSVTLKFVIPIKDVIDERKGTKLSNGNRYTVRWKQNEAVVISFVHDLPA